MESRPQEYEGTWEEVVTHAPEFAGRRVRLTFLDDEKPSSPTPKRSIEQTLAELAAEVPPEEWDSLPNDLSDQLDHYIYGWHRRGRR